MAMLKATRSAAEPRLSARLEPPLIKHLLGRVVAFQRIFVDVTCSVNAALMLSQGVYLSAVQPTPQRGGWFFKSCEEWKEEVGLSRHEQDGARKILRKSAVWEEELRGVPAKLWFRINFEVLRDKLLQVAENRQTSLLESDKSVGGKLANRAAGNQQTGLPETDKHLLPSETTTERAQRGSGPNTGGNGGGGHPPNKDSTASAFLAFGFEARFGAPFFQRCVVQRAKELVDGNIVGVMESVIQDMLAANRSDIPPSWYERKHALEVEARKPLSEPDRRVGSNGRKATDLFSRAKLRNHIAKNAELLRKSAVKFARDGERRIVEIAKSLEGIEMPAHPDIEFVERQCSSLDEELYALLTDLADPALIQRLELEWRAEIARGRSKMSEHQLAVVGKQVLQKRLLAEFKLPRLSLYYLTTDNERKSAKERNPKRHYAGAIESGYLFGEQP
jgi:hypothetical protein